MAIGSVQDRVNRRVYWAASVVRHYRTLGLDRAEASAFHTYAAAFTAKQVLDLGVGTGRTTRFLAERAQRYVCADFSPRMVAHIQHNFPKIDVALCDMRDLSMFPDESFDFVLAACNLLDAVGHEDRLRVLAEVRRVLVPRGVFMFSSHNRRFRAALSGPILGRSSDWRREVLHVLRYCRSVVNHARVGRYRRLERDYAILNDSGHDYAVLHYYIDRATQRRQLEQAGFQLLSEFDLDGRGLQAADDDADQSSVFYVAARGDAEASIVATGAARGRATHIGWDGDVSWGRESDLRDGETGISPRL